MRKLSLVFAAAVVSVPVTATAQSEEPPATEPQTEAESETPSTEESPATESPATESPASEEPTSTAEAETDNQDISEDVDVSGLTWDIMGGRVRESGGILQAELGFSALPRAAYHHTIMPGLSVGGLAAFDYARYAPEAAFASSLILAGVARYSIYTEGNWSIGARAEPGVRIGLADPVVFGFLAHLQGHVGYAIQRGLIVGGGIDVPLELAILDQGPVLFTIPLLVGGFGEFHVTPQLALTADFKMGPHFNTTDRGGGTLFGMRLLGGLAVRL